MFKVSKSRRNELSIWGMSGWISNNTANCCQIPRSLPDCCVEGFLHAVKPNAGNGVFNSSRLRQMKYVKNSDGSLTFENEVTFSENDQHQMKRLKEELTNKHELTDFFNKICLLKQSFGDVEIGIIHS